MYIHRTILAIWVLTCALKMSKNYGFSNGFPSFLLSQDLSPVKSLRNQRKWKTFSHSLPPQWVLTFASMDKEWIKALLHLLHIHSTHFQCDFKIKRTCEGPLHFHRYGLYPKYPSTQVPLNKWIDPKYPLTSEFIWLNSLNSYNFFSSMSSLTYIYI